MNIKSHENVLLIWTDKDGETNIYYLDNCPLYIRQNLQEIHMRYLGDDNNTLEIVDILTYVKSCISIMNYGKWVEKNITDNHNLEGTGINCKDKPIDYIIMSGEV